MRKERAKWFSRRFDDELEDETDHGYEIMNGEVGTDECQVAFISDITNRDCKGIASRIVKAVNCHDELLWALKALHACGIVAAHREDHEIFVSASHQAKKIIAKAKGGA